MTGRGVDQILPHPGDAEVREPVTKDARAYRDLAESVNGLIPAPVDFAWRGERRWRRSMWTHLTCAW